MSEEKQEMDRRFNKLIILVALALVAGMVAYAVPSAPYLIKVIGAVLMLLFSGLAIKCGVKEFSIK